MKQESFENTSAYFTSFVAKIRELISQGYVIDSQLFVYPHGSTIVGEYSIIAHKNNVS